MSIRQELETKLATFAAAQTPPIPISWEGVSFTKPTNLPWLQMFLISSTTISSDVAATRIRERGTLAITVWSPSGSGAGVIEILADKIVQLFPVVPKTGTVSIEGPGNSGRIMLDNSGWLALPITFPYRVEAII